MNHPDGQSWLGNYPGSLDFYSPGDFHQSPMSSEGCYPVRTDGYDYDANGSGCSSTSYPTPADYQYGPHGNGLPSPQDVGMIPSNGLARRSGDQYFDHNHSAVSAHSYQEAYFNQVNVPQIDVNYYMPVKRPGRTRRNSDESIESASWANLESEHPSRMGRNKERNRLAASKCREKSKKQIDDLKQRERELVIQRAALTAHAAGLKEEVLQLKNEILKHGDCDCDYIQRYLSKAAREVA